MRIMGVREFVGRWKFVLLVRIEQRIVWPGARLARKVDGTPRYVWEGFARDGLVMTS